MDVNTVSALTAGMVLEDVIQIDCAAGCGDWLYSDRGPVECPCHWSTARVVELARVLQGVSLGRWRPWG